MRLPALFLLFALATAAAAQTVYRYVTPDGRTIFSDTPVPGATLQGTVAPPPPPSGSPKLPAAHPPAPGSSINAPGGDGTNLRQVTIDVDAASRALAQAQAQLEAGKEPLPGERTGTVSGHSRLNDAYWARQAQNEKAVADARARLDAAIAARNAAR